MIVVRLFLWLVILGVLASPIGRVEVASQEAAVDAVRKAADEHEAETVVVGVPYNMDGSTGEMAKAALAFVDRLEAATSLAVRTWDERLTTVQAERALLQGKMTRKKRKAKRDVIAAQIILQSYLDAQSASAPLPPPNGD